jgi:hypothetical protein
VLLSSAGSPLTPGPTPATSTSRPPSNPTETRGFGGDPGKASGRNARVVTAGFVDIVSFDKLASVCSEYLTRAREVAWSASSGCPSGPAGTASSAPESRSSPTPPVPQRRRDHEEVVVAVRRKIAGHRPGSVGVARRRHLGHEAAGGRSVQDRSSSTRPVSVLVQALKRMCRGPDLVVPAPRPRLARSSASPASRGHHDRRMTPASAGRRVGQSRR